MMLKDSGIQTQADTTLPEWHPAIGTSTRTLKQASPVPAGYIDAVRRLMDDPQRGLRVAVKDCLISPTFMRYSSVPGTLQNGAAVFSSGAWLRAFFHDAGTFLKQPTKGRRTGGPNGSLAAGCADGNCGKCAAGPGCFNPGGEDPAPIPVPAGSSCADGSPAVTDFSIPGSFCCPMGHCIVKSTSSANPLDVVPSCQRGAATFADGGGFLSYSNELCRRENDGLQDTIQFYRNRQANATFQYRDGQGQLQPISMADILYIGAVAVVESCSGGKVKPQLLVGRKDASEPDSSPLPSTSSVIADKHHSIFQEMGLNKIDMVTLVTGSHSIGGLRGSNSPGLTTCPFVPFDCTPAGQFGAQPFDNNVFKVACDVVAGVTTGSCSFNTMCPSTTNTGTSQSANGTCPFGASAFPDFNSCSSDGSFPRPGLVSDKFWCQSDRTTQQRMLLYARDEDFFFKVYDDSFVKLGALGYKGGSLVAA